MKLRRAWKDGEDAIRFEVEDSPGIITVYWSRREKGEIDVITASHAFWHRAAETAYETGIPKFAAYFLQDAWAAAHGVPVEQWRTWTIDDPS